MKKRIVIDCRFWGSGYTGLGRYTQSLITAIYKKKPKLDLYLLTSKENKLFITKLLPQAKLIIAKSRPYSLEEQTEIPKLLKVIKPDLVHFLHFNVPLFTPKPFIVTIHDLIKHHSKGSQTTTHLPFIYPIKRLGYHLTVKQTILRSEKILVPSNWVKNDILSFYPFGKNKIVITPEAADPVFFSKSKLKSPLKSPYLLYVGNAYPHKNVIQLIKAVNQYNQVAKPKLKLLIVTGRNVFYQRLRKNINKFNVLHHIKLKDYSSDKILKSYYQHSKAFITASLFEGFGLPGLEAMASQTLVLASKRASMPEIYQNHAFYFDPDSIDDIVKTIKNAVSLSPAQRLKKVTQAQNYARTFSWGLTAENTLKVYENCLSLRSNQ